MMYPKTDAEEWAKMYGLVISEKQCINCKRNFLANIPIADKDMRGLQIPDHGCPSEYNRAYFTFVNKELEMNKARTLRMTRRDYFAAAALQGLLAAGSYLLHQIHIEQAVQAADALIAELDKEEEDNEKESK